MRCAHHVSSSSSSDCDVYVLNGDDMHAPSHPHFHTHTHRSRAHVCGCCACMIETVRNFSHVRNAARAIRPSIICTLETRMLAKLAHPSARNVARARHPATIAAGNRSFGYKVCVCARVCKLEYFEHLCARRAMTSNENAND